MYTKMYNLVFCLLLAFAFFLTTVYGQIGEMCKTDDGSIGMCVSVLNCPSHLMRLKEKKFVKPCGFNGTLPFTCCKAESGKKAKQKCQEYTQLARIFNPQHIIGGQQSKRQEFPHMVALGYEDVETMSWNCGGSLISEQYVLTAAHCLNSRLGPVKFARLGTINLKNPEEGGLHQDFQISRAIPHPDYKYPSKYNDIALLKLDSNVTFTKFVRPACLHMDFNIVSVIVGTGWGFLEAGGDVSDNLMKVDLVPYSYSDCRRTYGTDLRSLPYGIIDEMQVCAGGQEGKEKDTCNGDSGGPIQILLNKIYSVVGVTSFGKECGLPNVPAIYTRVSSYISWIEDVAWPSG